MKKIPLTQDKFALVDDIDFDYLNQWKWCFTKDPTLDLGYAMRTLWLTRHKSTTLRMHRVIMELILGHAFKQMVDHVDRDPLNNQRVNLRLATPQQQSANCHSKCGTSKFKGVHWVKDRGIWRAQIRVDNKLITLGQFTDEIEAAEAYNKAAKEYFGGFAYLNSID